MDIWFSQMDTENVKTSIRVDKQLFSATSEYQRIDVFQSKEFGKMIVLDGEIIFSEADEFIYNEMVVHVPMAVHPHVKNVLIIGGGDGGVARTCIEYPEIETIDVVEPDEMFVKVSRKFFPETAKGFDDERVKITNLDGLRFLRRCENQYDLIINDSTDPFGHTEGLFTREFYGKCYRALREDGIMVYQHGSPFYDEDEAAFRAMHRKVYKSFPISRVSVSYTHLDVYKRQGHRCLVDCKIEDTCPYSAAKIYLRDEEWYSDTIRKVVALEATPEALTEALKTGLYGRCVYRCDNNVVDHQVVNLQFEDGVTASFTMCAFTQSGSRVMNIMGTKGQIVCDMEKSEIEVRDFLTGNRTTTEVKTGNSGHSGSDEKFMKGFIKTVETDGAYSLSSAEVSVGSHLMALAAEESRVTGKTVYMDDFRKKLENS